MTASSRVIESTAPLLAVYATCGVAAPSFATNDAVLMIDPPPARRSAGMPNLQPKKTPRALMRIVSSHVSSLVEIASSSDACMMPALLNSTFKRPNSRSACAIIASLSFADETSAWTYDARPPPSWLVI